MEQQIIDTQKITRFLYDKCWSKFTFCKECKISRVTFDKIMNNAQKIKLTTMFKIARVMNVPVTQLILAN